jgi:hypothetical protein
MAADKERAMVFRIGRHLISVVCGILGVAAWVEWHAEWYYGLLGIGLIVWAVYSIAQEVRNAVPGGEVANLAAEREEIERKLQEKK